MAAQQSETDTAVPAESLNEGTHQLHHETTKTTKLDEEADIVYRLSHQESGTPAAGEVVHVVIESQQLDEDTGTATPKEEVNVATDDQSHQTEAVAVATQQSSQDVQHLQINLPEWLANSKDQIVIICSDNDESVAVETGHPNQHQEIAIPIETLLDNGKQGAAASVSSAAVAQPGPPTPGDDPQDQVVETQVSNVTVIVREAKPEDDVGPVAEAELGKTNELEEVDLQGQGENVNKDKGGKQFQHKGNLTEHDYITDNRHSRKENEESPLSQVSRRSKRKAAMSPRRRWCRAGCCEDGKQHSSTKHGKSNAVSDQNVVDLAGEQDLCDAINEDAVEKLSAEESDGPSTPKRKKSDGVVLQLNVTPIVKKRKRLGSFDNKKDSKSDASSPKKTLEPGETSSDCPVPVNIVKLDKSRVGKTATDLLSELQSDMQSEMPTEIPSNDKPSSDEALEMPEDDPSDTTADETPDVPVEEVSNKAIDESEDQSPRNPTDEQADTPSVNAKFECICGTNFTHKKSLIRHFRRKGVRDDGMPEEGAQHFSKYPIAIYPNTKAPDRKPKQTTFPCPHCPKVLNTKGGIDYHIMSHTGAKPVTCSLCDKSFKSKQILDQHFVIHTNGELPYKCEQCGRTYLTSTRLRAHQKIHGEKHFKCKYCHHAFVMEKDLNKHMRVHTGEKPFQCEFCDERFHFSQDRKRHHMTNHGDKAEFKCDFCPKFFFKEDELEKHVKIHNGNDTDYSCGICGQNFSSFTTMRNHRMTHSSDFHPFACRYESCNMIFKCSNDRYLHERKTHDMSLFKCQYCSLSFKKQNAYEEHQKKHEEASYVCRVDKECGERFQQAHVRLRHEKSHSQDPSMVKLKGKRGPVKKKNVKKEEGDGETATGAQETIYQCGVCWKTYKNYPSLRDHVREHSDDMPYGCRVQGCQKRFKRVYHRRKHEQTHSTDEIINSVIDSRLRASEENMINASEEEEIIIETEGEYQVQQEQQETIHVEVLEPDMSDTVAATEVVEATEITVGEETQIAVEFVMH